MSWRKQGQYDHRGGASRTTPARALALALLGLAVWAVPSAALACGSLTEVVARYRAPGADDGQREAALRALGRGCPDYAGEHSDRLVFEVLINAVVLGFNRGAIQRVFDEYECVIGARGQVGYDTLAATLDSSACPRIPEPEVETTVATVDEDEGEAADEPPTLPVYRLNVEAANLRRGPGNQYPPIAVIYDTQDLTMRGQTGSWFQVELPDGTVGYVFSELIERVRNSNQ